MGQVKYILVVEDDPDIASTLKWQFESTDFFQEFDSQKSKVECTTFAKGSDFLEFIQDSSFSNRYTFQNTLILLDYMLPDSTGLALCQFLRTFKQTKEMGIFFLTALSDTETIVQTLQAGADDFLTKPYEIEVLLTKVKNYFKRLLLWKTASLSSDVLKTKKIILGKIELRQEECRVWSDGEEIFLTSTEFKILSLLMNHPGKVFTRKQLVEKVKDGPIFITERTIDTHIFSLRKKLKGQSSLIETLRGIGYKANGST